MIKPGIIEPCHIFSIIEPCHTYIESIYEIAGTNAVCYYRLFALKISAGLIVNTESQGLKRQLSKKFSLAAT